MSVMSLRVFPDTVRQDGARSNPLLEEIASWRRGATRNDIGAKVNAPRELLSLPACSPRVWG